jgi:carbonic anhydrase
MTTKALVSPEEAVERLLEGNKRYRNQESSNAKRLDESRRRELTGGQAPFASVLTCADSRTPPEHIFDAALGEVFVCRNAGNVLNDATLGSIEYAAVHTGCPVVVVMGHSSCGAVGAAVAAATAPDAHETHNVDDIIRRIMPAVMATAEGQTDEKEWIDMAAKKNVLLSCRHILQRSNLLRRRVREGAFAVAGAWYNLESGKVSVLFKTSQRSSKRSSGEDTG